MNRLLAAVELFVDEAPEAPTGRGYWQRVAEWDLGEDAVLEAALEQAGIEGWPKDASVCACHGSAWLWSAPDTLDTLYESLTDRADRDEGYDTVILGAVLDSIEGFRDLDLKVRVLWRREGETSSQREPADRKKGRNRVRR